MEKNKEKEIGLKKPCELYVGSDFLGSKDDYEELKRDLGINPMPEKLKRAIARDGRLPKIDDVKPCLQTPTTLLFVGHEKGRWVCETHYIELAKYHGG